MSAQAQVLDARGRRCPYPVVLLGRAAAQSAPGRRLELLSDDPVSLNDVPAWCRMQDAVLESVEDQGDHWSFRVVTGRSADQPTP